METLHLGLNGSRILILIDFIYYFLFIIFPTLFYDYSIYFFYFAVVLFSYPNLVLLTIIS